MSNHPPSPQQEVVLAQVKDPNGGNIVLKAVAGSGKTTTLMMTLKHLEGEVIIVAFNKDIATEIGDRVSAMELTNVESRTVHSAGMRSLLRAKGRTLTLKANGKSHEIQFPKELDVDGSKYSSIIREYVRGFNVADPETLYELTSTLSRLVDLCRLHLLNPADYDALLKIGVHHGLKHLQYRTHVTDIMTIGMRQYREKGKIDFTDMVYLPVRFGLPMNKYEWVLVDECQDLSPLQLEFVKRLGNKDTRYIFVGDPKQAIYGFAGADHRSFEKIIEVMKAHVLPLSVCYRCGKLIIAEAQKIVPYIEAHPDKYDGEVLTIEKDDFFALVEVGDLVLCRLNAPLVQACLSFIAMGEKAAIKGRELGPMLKSMVKKAAKHPGFRWDLIDEYLIREVEERIDFFESVNASDSTKNGVFDLYTSVRFVIKSLDKPLTSAYAFNKQVDAMFTVRDDATDVIWMSTIHKSKGLEAEKVFVLAPERLPLRFAKQQKHELEQEMNLKYVAITRAMKSFHYVLTPQEQEGINVRKLLEALEAGNVDIGELLLDAANKEDEKLSEDRTTGE